MPRLWVSTQLDVDRNRREGDDDAHLDRNRLYPAGSSVTPLLVAIVWLGAS